MELNGKDIFGKRRLDFMFRLACSILGRSDEAQDMMQDVAERILRRQEDLEDVRNMDSFLARAVRNACIDRIRWSDRQLVHKALARLPERQRLAVHLKDIEGYSNKELADILETDDIYDDYAGKKGYQSVVYGKKMITMMKENASSDVRRLLNGITMIRIISHEGPETDLYDDARKIVREEYDLVSRMDEDDDMSFVMIASGPGSKVVLEIIGRFDVKDISKLSIIGQKSDVHATYCMKNASYRL